ncbi:ThiJ/PfpI family protein [Hypoxylon sp. NC0597]|nr:ThiJ/PfpI family protein [Hypoxylon sp. NC0597]
MASENKSGSGRHTVRIGVFIPTDCQVLDAASVDIMGTMSYECTYKHAQIHYRFLRSHVSFTSSPPGGDFELVSAIVPKAVIDLAPEVKIHYIGSVKTGEPIKLTANETILATNHFSDPEVAPGKLDIIHIPGPDPFRSFPADALAWLREQASTPGVDILSVCSGIFLCGEAGLLKGRKACGPRGMQDMIKAKGYGEKELLGHKYRWIQDGNLWSRGVTNGNDLVAAYCRASKHFPDPIVEIVCEMVDVGDRPQEYAKGQSAFIFGMVYNAFRAWLMKFSWRRKQR